MFFFKKHRSKNKKKKKQFFKVTTYGVSQRQKKASVNAIMQKKRLIVYSADFC